MLVNANKTELLKLAQHFYHISKTLISFYDKDQRILCAYPDMGSFCTEVRRSKLLYKRCIECDEKAFEICEATHKTYIYRCHMGLIEIATPIVYGNTILGYVLFGQIADSPDKAAVLPHIEKAAAEYHLNQELLINNLSEVHYRSEEYIHSAAKLLEMCASYIWLNSIISIKKEGIAHNIDAYITEHIKDSLTIPLLCREFGIGRTTLYDISRTNFGCSISEYIQQQRNETAKKMLKNTNSSLSEVASAVGIEDVNYFIRFFKKMNGCTPKKYRTSSNFP